MDYCWTNWAISSFLYDAMGLHYVWCELGSEQTCAPTGYQVFSVSAQAVTAGGQLLWPTFPVSQMSGPRTPDT